VLLLTLKLVVSFLISRSYSQVLHMYQQSISARFNNVDQTTRMTGKKFWTTFQKFGF
jgi:hypothetical protein